MFWHVPLFSYPARPGAALRVAALRLQRCFRVPVAAAESSSYTMMHGGHRFLICARLRGGCALRRRIPGEVAPVYERARDVTNAEVPLALVLRLMRM